MNLRMPKLADVERLVATLDRHPFGALMLALLVALLFAGVAASAYVLRR